MSGVSTASTTSKEKKGDSTPEPQKTLPPTYRSVMMMWYVFEGGNRGQLCFLFIGTPLRQSDIRAHDYNYLS